MTRTRIKICGLTREEDVRTAVEAGADALGFVFYPGSPRFVPAARAASLASALPAFVSAVGLFVNAKTADVAETSRQVRLSLLQFHGDETPGQCHEAAVASNLPFIRVFRVRTDTTADDLLQCEKGFIAMPVRFSRGCCWIPLRMPMAERERFSIGLSCQKKSGLGSF